MNFGDWTTESKICAKCGEDNPAQAVMCWSCGALLGRVDPNAGRGNDDDLEISFPQRSRWRSIAETIAPYLVATGLISSGWWRGKTRFTVLGATIGFIVAGYALDKWEEIKEKREEKNSISPILRIANTIMLYALKDGATQILLFLKEGNVVVKYRVGKEWQDQMMLPHYVWKPIILELATLAGSGNIEFDYEGESAHFGLHILIEPPNEQIVLTVLTVEV